MTTTNGRLIANVCAARPADGDEPKKGEIYISVTIPEWEGLADGERAKAREALFIADAERLAEVLVATLPTGTLNALIGQLIELRSARHFFKPFLVESTGGTDK